MAEYVNVYSCFSIKKVQHRPHFLQSAVQMRLHGAFRTSEHSTRLFCRQTVEVPQDYRCPLECRQLVERTLAKGRPYQDNVTVVSVTLAPDDYSDEPGPRPAFTASSLPPPLPPPLPGARAAPPLPGVPPLIPPEDKS